MTLLTARVCLFLKQQKQHDLLQGPATGCKGCCQLPLVLQMLLLILLLPLPLLL
jgi:hypothetical protein